LFFDALQNDPRTDNKGWVDGGKCAGNNQSPRAATASWDEWPGQTIVMPARPLIPPDIIEDYVSFRNYANEELRARAIRNLFGSGVNSLVFRRYYGAGSPLLASAGNLLTKPWKLFRGDRLESAPTNQHTN